MKAKSSKALIALCCLLISIMTLGACKTVQADINPYTKMTWKTEEWENFDKNSIVFTIENPRWNPTKSSIDLSWSLPEGNGDWAIIGDNYLEFNGNKYPFHEMQLLSGVRTDLRGGQQTINVDENNKITAGYLNDTEKVDTYIKYKIFIPDVPEDFSEQAFRVHIEKLFFIPREGSQYDPEYLEAIKKRVDEVQPGIGLKPFESTTGLEAISWPKHLSYEEAQQIVSDIEYSLHLQIDGPWNIEYIP